jgi:DNA-binding NarL/FixJ family response regulator
MIRIIVADDHKLVRRGITSLLKSSKEIEVVAEAENGNEAVELTEKLAPDLVVMDVSMPQLDGISATKRIQEMDLPTRVLMLSIHRSKSLVRIALSTGAQGYVLKHKLASDLIPAIHLVKQGDVFISDDLGDILGRGY